MNLAEIYKHLNYKDFLKSLISHLPNNGRGVKSSIANFIGCQPTYISRVLEGDSHLTLEQASLVADFFKLPGEERIYFFNQIQYARAGSESLRTHFLKQLKLQQKKLIDISQNISETDELNADFKDGYYESWLPSAIHILLTIENLSSVEALSTHLGVSEQKISETLSFLVKAGLVSTDGFNHTTTQLRIHTPEHSRHTLQHHMNWRLKTLSKLQEQGTNEDLHYSSVVTADEKTIREIRADIVKSLVKHKALIKDAPAKQGYCFNMDLFRIHS